MHRSVVVGLMAIGISIFACLASPTIITEPTASTATVARTAIPSATTGRGVDVTPASHLATPAYSGTGTSAPPWTPSPQPTLTPMPRIVSQLPAPVISLAVSPQDAEQAYALVDTLDLYRTENGGGLWQHIDVPLTRSPYPSPYSENSRTPSITHQLAVWLSPESRGRLFVGAQFLDNGILASDNAGATWRVLNDNVRAWAVADHAGRVQYAWRASPQTSDMLDVPIQPHGLYRTADGGATWQQVYHGYMPPENKFGNHEGVTALIVNPIRPDTIFVGLDFGIWRSQDGGRTWSSFNDGLPPHFRLYRWVPMMAANSEGVVYALTETSPDGGSAYATLARLRPGENSWKAIGDKLIPPRGATRHFGGMQTLITDPRIQSRLYAGTESGLFVSDNYGDAWQPLQVPDVKIVYRIAPSTETPARLYLWTDRGLRIVRAPAAR